MRECAATSLAAGLTELARPASSLLAKLFRLYADNVPQAAATAAAAAAGGAPPCC